MTPTPDEIAAAKERLKRERDCDCFSSYPNCQCENLAQAIDVLLVALEQAEEEVAACDGHGYLREQIAELEAKLAESERTAVNWHGEYHTLKAERDALREALRKLFNKLSLLSVFQIAAIHGQKYNGPTWSEELMAARAALAIRQQEGPLPLGHEFEEFVPNDGADCCARTYCGQPEAAHRREPKP